MKKVIYGVLIFSTISLVFLACKKESGKNFTETIHSNTKSSNSQIENVQGLLKFNDIDHVSKTIAKLEDSFNKQEEKFLKKYKGSTGEEFIQIEENIGYQDHLPFIEFENNLNFSSLRKSIEEKLKNYLLVNDDGLDNPDSHFIIEKEVRAILNENSEMIIGSDIYKFYPEGYIIIANQDFSKLFNIRNDKSLIFKLSGIKIEGSFEKAACNGHQAQTGNYTTGTRRIHWRVAIQTFPWDRYVIAKSVNYVKKNGNWKKIRGYTKCRVWGDVGNYTLVNGQAQEDCDKPLNFNTVSGFYSDQSDVKDWKHKISVQTRTQTNWVKGYHYSEISAGTTYNSNLNF